MSTIEFVKRLSDEEVLLLLKRHVHDERAATTQLLIHFGEVDARGLFREEGYSSMFAYAVQALHMSEPEAALRIRAARFARKFPAALEMLARGELHLTAICLLSPVVNTENAELLLRLAQHKSKYEVQELIAKHFPQPDVRSEVRKLPTPARSASTSSLTSDASFALAQSRTTSSCNGDASFALPQSTATSSGNSNAIAHGVSLQSAGLNCDPVLQSPDTAKRDLVTVEGQGGGQPNLGPRPRASDELSPRVSESTRPVVQAQPSRMDVQAPLSEGRYKVTFTARKAFTTKLERAKALLRREVPAGDLEAVFERALDLLIADREKKMFGVTKNPRPVERKSATERANSRYVPRALRRTVYERDKGQCTFTASNGTRCGSRDRLELHHILAFALGGRMNVENIELRCRAHNVLDAERDFGRDRLKQRIREREILQESSRTKPQSNQYAGASSSQRPDTVQTTISQHGARP